MPHFKRRTIPMLLSMSFLTAVASANEAPQLETVVVTAAGYQQNIIDAPASISVISREQLQSKTATSLPDALRKLEGVSVVGSSADFMDISIRGMPGEYTLILVDGKRQNTRETMNRKSGGVQASLLPPLSAIERIEVIRGPMSSLYGSDAVGGVINIITRKSPKAWSGTLSASTVVQEDRNYGDTRQTEFWLSGPLKEGFASLQMFGNYKQRDEDQIYFPISRNKGTPDTRTRNLGGKLTLRPNAQHTLEFDVGRYDLRYQRAYLAPKLPLEESLSKRDNIGLTHKGSWESLDTKLALYREVGSYAYTRTDLPLNPSVPEIANTVLDGTATLALERNTLSVGGQYTHAKLSNISSEFTPVGYNNPNDISRAAWALFAENVFQYSPKLSLTGGLRMDHSQDYGSHYSPRLYAVYKLDDAWSLRGGASSAFKTPTIRQSTANFCMQTRGGAATLCGNPNLKPEESVSGEFGIRYDGAAGQNFSATLFKNVFKNKVVNLASGKPDPLNSKRDQYIYDNLAKADTTGLEMALNWPLSKVLAMSANYTYTDSRRRGNQEVGPQGQSLDGDALWMTPKHQANLSLNWQASDALSTYAQASYNGKQVWHEARAYQERPASTTVDAGLNYKLLKNYELNFAVRNLTDKIVPLDDRSFKLANGNWMVDEGRRYELKFSASF